LAVEKLDILDIDDVPDSEEEKQELKQRFRITDKAQANWALKKLKKRYQTREENKKLMDEEIEKIKSWYEEEDKKIQRNIDFFTGLLEEYHRSLYAQDPSIKTISLPYGKTKIRDIGEEYVYDDDALVKWLLKNAPEYIEMEPKIKKAELKKKLKEHNGKAVLDTGEVVDGIALVERPPKFSVEII
jgi:hypothetical protein